MLVVTGPVTQDGKSLPHGTPIPEALAWPSYVLKVHLDAGWIREMGDDEIDAFDRVHKAQQKSHEAKMQARAIAKAESEVSSAERFLTDASRALELAKARASKAQESLKLASAALAEPVTEEPPAPSEDSGLSGLSAEELASMAEELGVVVSKRWGLPRLRKEIEDALES